MKRSVSLTALAVLLAASLGMASCGDDSSTNNPVDGDQETTGDQDPTDNQDTTGDQDEGVVGGCLNNDMCPDGQACDLVEFMCKAEECASNAECVTDENPEQVCSAGLCYPTTCVTSADCQTAGYVCSGGACIKRDPTASTVAEVSLFAPTSVLRSGQTVTLVATALNSNGFVVTTDAALFTWSSGTETVATVAGGVVTGAGESGAVTITAQWSGDTTKSASVTLRNFGDVEAGKVRVVVYDIKSGDFIAGATVILDDATQTTGQGVDAGVALFDAAAGTHNVHVFADGHDWVSAFGVEGDDFVFPIEPIADNTVSGGITGALDFSPIPAIYRADIKAGIAGMAIEGNLLDIQFETLLGDSLVRHIQLSNLVNEDVPLPGGIQLEIGVNKIAPEFFGFASEGPSIAWALGGYLPLQDVIDIASGALGGGGSVEDLPIGQIVADVIPFLENFYHGVLPGINVVQHPKVVDANDLNGNEDTTDLIFDRTKFQNVGNQLALAQRQVATTRLSFGTFDIFENAEGSGALVLAATSVDGIGFVPLGLSVSLDENENGVTDGALDPVDMMFAPQHGGVEGYPYYFLALGLNIDALIGGGAMNISAVIKRYDSGYPTTMTVSGFPKFPRYNNIALGATPAATTIRLDKATGDTGANAAYRVVLSGSGLRWNVYVAPDAPYTLPELPGTFAARWDDVKPANMGDLQINTITLSGGLSYSGLFQFNGTNLDQLNQLTDGFVLMFPED